ncbi:MAG: transglutaminase-like domain-containing protein [Pseudomonadota bacterium]
MIKIKLGIELRYDIAPPGSDLIFNIHAAHTRQQMVTQENLQISQALIPQIHTDKATSNRYLRLSAAPGPLTVRYGATVALHHHLAQPEQISEIPVARLPMDVMGYVYPSRYCQSDQLHRLAVAEFGHLWQGYGRVQAIQEWVQRRVKFTNNASNSNTSALETLRDGVGICRDFAHLMIALCRAVNIPARFTTGIDYGADPALGPTDFHAYVEVYLGHRWYIFDPSGTAIPMGFVRFGTGRDAADVAYATIFGTVTSALPLITVEALAAPHAVMPYACREALSTDE